MMHRSALSQCRTSLVRLLLLLPASLAVETQAACVIGYGVSSIAPSLAANQPQVTDKEA
jgi:hypothetical protein